MNPRLEEIEATLYEGMHLGQTRSSRRRAPKPAGVPLLKKALADLRRLAAAEPRDARVLRLLSLAEEAMLNYGPAIGALERAMELDGKRDKRDLKRLALLRESGSEWDKLSLTPQQLAQLGAFLQTKLDDGPNERSFRWTEEWLADHGFNSESVRRIIAGFEERGAFSDFQIYYNVVR